MGRTPTKEKKCVTLEDYIDFFENRHSYDLTISSFNQIIYTHGFKKLHRSHKKDVTDALNNLDLLSPYRSSLKEKKSSPSSSCVAASLTTEGVLTDLDVLQWQECSLQSIETLNPMKEIEEKEMKKREDLQTSASSDNNKNARSNKRRKKVNKPVTENVKTFGLAAANAVSSYWLGIRSVTM